MLHTLRFYSLQNVVYFINATFFGSCVIHILYTECAKIKNNSDAKGLILTYIGILVMWGIQLCFLYGTKIHILIQFNTVLKKTSECMNYFAFV